MERSGIIIRTEHCTLNIANLDLHSVLLCWTLGSKFVQSKLLHKFLPVCSAVCLCTKSSHINCSVAQLLSENSRKCLIEHVCHGVKCEALWAVVKTGYCATYKYLPLLFVTHTGHHSILIIIDNHCPSCTTSINF